jgi:hypothetical protein
MQSNRCSTQVGIGGCWSGILLIALAAFIYPAEACADPFTAGNLAVVTVTQNGAQGNTGAVSLREYTTGGVFTNNSVNLPSSGAGNLLTLTFNQGLEGGLSLSENGQFFSLVGYNAASGVSPGVANTRTVARVGIDGTVDVSTSTTSFVIPERPHSATTNDGTRFWVGGGNGSGQVGTTPFGASGTAVTTVNAANTRGLNVVNGQLYGSTATTIYRTDTPLPTTSSSITPLVTTGLVGAVSFVLLDRDSTVAGVDTLYVADTNNGLVKYSFDGTTWTQRGASDVGGALAGITGFVNGTSASLFVTTFDGTTVESFTDTAAFNADLTGAFADLITAGSGIHFRGVSIVPEPGSLLLGGAACVGLAGTALRRYRRYRAANASREGEKD